MYDAKRKTEVKIQIILAKKAKTCNIGKLAIIRVRKGQKGNYLRTLYIVSTINVLT